MRLGLQAHGELVVQLDEAGVVHKAAQHKTRLLGHELLRGALDEGLVHALDFLRLAVHRVLNGGGENAVLAVLRPGLGDYLELHIRGVAVNLAENLLHHQHILGGEGKLHVLAQRSQLAFAQITNRNGTISSHGIKNLLLTIDY